jgi:zeta-carotene desaturase
VFAVVVRRYDGWVTELQDSARVKDLRSPAGIDNLLYSADTYFSCFADLALTSPVEYFKEGEGSLMQCVITPAAPYFPWTNEAIAAETDKQVGTKGSAAVFRVRLLKPTSSGGSEALVPHNGLQAGAWGWVCSTSSPA